jgi:DNA-directed RNA polymerase subunit RPC12/RpoP
MPFNNGKLPSLKSILGNLVDELNRFLIIIDLILIIVSIFIKSFTLDLLKFLFLFLVIFRLTSKNKVQRTKENKTYLKIVKILTKPFTNIIRNFKDRKTHVYKKCHKCKTTLKLPLPKTRGINHAKCPECGNRVTLFTLRKKEPEKIKVEVIKKKK